MSEKEQPAARLGGRPRNTQIDAAVLDASSELLEEVGYHAFAIEQVVKRAGVTKTAVYRRWPNRQSLVLDELGRRAGRVTTPDTGCVVCDLTEALSLFARVFRCMGPGIFSSLLADCSTTELRQRFMEVLFAPPRDAVAVTLERARDRGDLRDDVDLTLVVDSMAALIHYRLLFEHAPVDQTQIESIVNTLLRGVAHDFESLRRTTAAHQAKPDEHPPSHGEQPTT